MPSKTTIRVCDATGAFLFETAAFLEAGSSPGLHYVLNCGQVGAMTVTLPPEFNSKLPVDGRVHIMRSVNGGPAQREGGSCFLIRDWQYGDNYTTITALHANDLIRRRHVLYGWVIGLASTPGASNLTKGYIQNIAADDGIKRIWRENAGSSVDTTYRAYSSVTGANNTTQADISAYVSCAADVSAAPSLYKQFYWRNMLETFLDIENASTLLGTYLTTEIIVPGAESTLELRTYTGQRGADRRATSSSGLIFSSARGNLSDAVLHIDRTEEITFAQSLGAGPSTYYRYAGLALDTTRMAESPFQRIESVYDSSDAPNDATLTDDATALVRAGRPIITASGALQETDTCVRGIDFDFGDLLTVEVQGTKYDMRLDILDVTVAPDGERTQALFQYNG